MKQDDRVLGRQQWICDHLRHLRKEMGMTLAEVAERMHCSVGRVSDTESGYYDMRLSTFLKYLDALGINIKNFASHMPDSPSPDKLRKRRNG